MAAEFLRQLFQIENIVLSDDSRCCICLADYGLLCTETGVIECEIRLPCNHVVGSFCVAKWLSPTQLGHNSCPLCRREFFPAQPRPYLEHGIMNDDVDMVEDNSESESDDNDRRSREGANSIRYPRLYDLIAITEECEIRLYHRLQEGDESLELPPPLSRSMGPRLDHIQEEALFAELERRGAFEGPRPCQAEMSNRQAWAVLRSHFWCYGPPSVAQLEDPEVECHGNWFRDLRWADHFRPFFESGPGGDWNFGISRRSPS